MSDDWVRSLASVFRRLQVLARTDEPLRDALRGLAASIWKVTDRGEREELAPSREPQDAGSGAGGPMGGTDFMPASATGDAANETPSSQGDGAPLVRPQTVVDADASRELAGEVESSIAADRGPSHERDRDGPPASARVVEATPAGPLPPLTFAQPPRMPAASVTSGGAFPAVDDSELPLIVARCRLKADGCRWAATRRRRIEQGADVQTEITPMDRETIARAKALPDCFLWMVHASAPVPGDPSSYDDLAGCFDALASAVSLAGQVGANAAIVEDAAGLERALKLLAEAQFVVRTAVESIDGPEDADQRKVFHWLRATVARHQIYVPRFMRLDDVADPAAWPDLVRRIEDADGELQAATARHKRRLSALSRMRYHARHILDHASDDHAHDWKKILQAVEELVAEGVPPSSRDVREIILPLVDLLPDWDGGPPPPGFRQVLAEVDRFLASRTPDETAGDERRDLAAGPAIAAVRDLLQGRSLVLLGGQRRPYAEQALRDAFGLADLYWIDAPDHESIATFEPYVARVDVAAVLLAIRWSSHSYGEIRQFCERLNRPLVRLPGGYNANQVAAQILAQCSDRLRDSVA